MSRSALDKQMRMQMQRAQQQQFELRQQQIQRQQQLQQQQQAMAYAAAYQQQTGMVYDPYAMAAYQQQAAYYDPYGVYVAQGVSVDPSSLGYTGTGVDQPIDEEERDEDNSGVKANVVPMHGNASNYNINTLLFDNIMTSDYFRALFQLRTYHEVIAEIERVVKHVEPWQTGTSRSPSSAFCLLVKFMTIKLTYKQLNGLLTYSQNVYVRAIGLLYLRYVCPPTDLWKWVEPYVEDDQDILPSSDRNVKMTIGGFTVKLLTEMQFYGSTLPRIPLLIERKIKVFLLLLEEKKKRRLLNLRMLDRFVVDSNVEAIYSDDANEPAWYSAVITSIAEDDEAEGNREDNTKPRKIGIPSAKGVKRHMFWVTFPEYGNNECVDLGDMRLASSGASSTNAVAKDQALDEVSTEKSDKVVENKYEEGAVSHTSDAHRRNDNFDRSHRVDDGNKERTRSRSRERSHDNSRKYGVNHSRDRNQDRHRRHSRDTGRRDRYSTSSSHSRSPSYDRRHQNSSRGGLSTQKKLESTEDLLQKVLEAERNASTAVGKNYAHRPTSFKGALSMKLDTYTSRKRSPPRESGGRSDRRNRRSRSPSPVATSSYNDGAQMDRMKMLKERYGDASALNK